MALLDRVQKDMTEAMKARAEDRLSALRMMKAALKKHEIDSMKPLDERTEQQVLNTLIKQRREAADMFRTVPTIRDKMETLKRVGLGYVKVGQQATTLSGAIRPKPLSPRCSRERLPPFGGSAPARRGRSLDSWVPLSPRIDANGPAMEPCSWPPSTNAWIGPDRTVKPTSPRSYFHSSSQRVAQLAVLNYKCSTGHRESVCTEANARPA